MKHIRKSVGVLVLILALLLPSFQTQAAVIGTIRITMTKPLVGKALPTDAKVTNKTSIEVTDMKWSGKTKNGKVVLGTKYTAVITVEVKPDSGDQFSSGKISTFVNNKASNIKVERESATVVKVTYTFTLGETDKNGKPVEVKLLNTKGKNASEVKALKKIIEVQNANGANLSVDLLDSSQYKWNKEGRLAELRWRGKGLTGSLSLKEFTALEKITISTNELTKLELGKKTKLTWLWCQKNPLTKLDVSKCTSLDYLWCGYSLTGLDVSKNKALKDLHCGGNQLTKLDVSKNLKLELLWCSGNPLNKVDISKNKELKTVSFFDTQLTELDISKNTKLEYLDCEDNQLTELNVSKHKNLKALQCGFNQLTKLDVSKNPKLETLYCWHNQLTELDVSKNPKLWLLYCGNNQLTELDISKNPDLDVEKNLDYDKNSVMLIK